MPDMREGMMPRQKETCWLCHGLGAIAMMSTSPTWGAQWVSMAPGSGRLTVECPACALTKVNAELRAGGIEHPRGYRGVRDLRNFAARYLGLLKHIQQVAGLSDNFDNWPTELRAKLKGDV